MASKFQGIGGRWRQLTRPSFKIQLRRKLIQRDGNVSKPKQKCNERALYFFLSLASLKISLLAMLFKTIYSSSTQIY